MNSADLVQSALFSLALAAIGSGKPIQWPNKKFEPPTNALWFRVHYFPTDRARKTLGDLGEDEVDGFVQIDVNVPSDSGEKVQRQQLDILEHIFTSGRVTTYNGQEAVITACKRSPGRDVDGFYRVSLTVDFYARVKRVLLPVDVAQAIGDPDTEVVEWG